MFPDISEDTCLNVEALQFVQNWFITGPHEQNPPRADAIDRRQKSESSNPRPESDYHEPAKEITPKSQRPETVASDNGLRETV